VRPALKVFPDRQDPQVLTVYRVSKEYKVFAANRV
jgi:hypothetical protein